MGWAFALKTPVAPITASALSSSPFRAAALALSPSRTRLSEGAYREAFVWLRDFTDQKNAERGRVMCGGNWFTPQTIESVKERMRVQQLEKGRRQPPTR